MARSNITFNAKIKKIAEINPEFTLAKCYVAALGKNRNFSHIGKDASEAAMPSLFNIPVVGNLYVGEDGEYHMGGHDVQLKKDENGNYVFESITVPFGVVPERPDEVQYEEVEEPDGRGVHTYITCPIILWTGRYEALKEAVSDDGAMFNQSMEITIQKSKSLEEDPNYMDIQEYAYSALCLLGRSSDEEYNVTPCFPCSKVVEPTEFSFDDNFTKLMDQLKTELAFCFDDAGKKGDEVMDNNQEPVIEQAESVVEEPEVTEDVATEDAADGPVVEDDSTPATEEPQADAQFENHQNSENPEFEKFSATYREKRDAIEQALPNICVRDPETNHCVRSIDYWLCDFDDTYAYVERHMWDMTTGCSESKGRFAYTYDTDNHAAAVSGEFTEMFVRWLTQEEVNQIEENRKQYEILVEYRDSREKADREAEFDTAIEEFSYLNTNEEFVESVYDKRYAFESIEALKNACYLIKGKYSISAPKQKGTEPSVPVGTVNTTAKSLRDKLHDKYGRK